MILSWQLTGSADPLPNSRSEAQDESATTTYRTRSDGEGLRYSLLDKQLRNPRFSAGFTPHIFCPPGAYSFFKEGIVQAPAGLGSCKE
jgi:hypothetical protein